MSETSTTTDSSYKPKETDEIKPSKVSVYKSLLSTDIGSKSVTRAEWEAIKLEGDREFRRQSKQNTDQEPKNYLAFNEGVKAYSKVLDTDSTAEEALEYVAEFYGKDKAWVDEIKNRSYLHAKEVVISHENHPVQKAMVKDGTFSSHIKSGKTPNQHLRELKKSKDLHTTINDLKASKHKHQEEISDLRIKTTTLEKDVNVVMSQLSIETDTLSEKISYLRSKGFTIKEISKGLGVSVRTLNRNLPK